MVGQLFSMTRKWIEIGNNLIPFDAVDKFFKDDDYENPDNIHFFIITAIIGGEKEIIYSSESEEARDLTWERIIWQISDGDNVIRIW